MINQHDQEVIKEIDEQLSQLEAMFLPDGSVNMDIPDDELGDDSNAINDIKESLLMIKQIAEDNLNFIVNNPKIISDLENLMKMAMSADQRERQESKMDK